MSSEFHPGGVAEKIDIRKYLLVLKRRMWWGIIPFLLLAVTFGVICTAMPAKYRSSCVIRASRSEVAEMLGVGRRNRTRTSRAIVSEEIRRYGNVMAALAGTDLMAEIEREAGTDLGRKAELMEELYWEVSNNTNVGTVGREGVLIRVSYLGKDAEEAHTIVDRLSTYFVEHALKEQSDTTRRARQVALDEMTRTKENLESLENEIAAFREEHPGVTTGMAAQAKVEEYYRISAQLEELDNQIKLMSRRLNDIAQRLEEMPTQTIKEVKKRENREVELYETRLAELRNQLTINERRFTPLHPSIKGLKLQISATEQRLAEARQRSGRDEIVLEANKDRTRLEERQADLRRELDFYRLERRPELYKRKQRLEQEVKMLPSLQRQLQQMQRERDAAKGRYDTAQDNFKRLDREFNIKKEGLVDFRIVSGARVPRRPNYAHIYKLAVMGAFISLAAGVGAIAGTEFLDQSFTDVEAARDVLRLPSLGVIPLIRTARDRRRRRFKWLFSSTAFVVLASAVVLLVIFVPPVRAQAEKLWIIIRDVCKRFV
jgi:uncharacterized protein involved in exopolysaccharide biosynthesis